MTPQPLLVPWSWKGRAIPLLPLWAVWPVQSLSACTRLTFSFTAWRDLPLKPLRHRVKLCLYRLGYRWMDFCDVHWNMSRKYKSFVKTGQNVGRFTGKHKFVYGNMSLNFFLAGEKFQSQVTENMKIFSIKFKCIVDRAFLRWLTLDSNLGTIILFL
jgi:hypothetical protein